VVRVGAQDPDNLDLLDRLGLSPGCRVEVLGDEERGLRILVGDESLVLPTYLAEALWMEKENP
jgi:hypothetical protein